MDLPELQNREAIQAAQLSQLRRLIDACLAGNPFYAERSKKAGLDANLKTLAQFTHRMGFTTKEQLVQDQAEHPADAPSEERDRGEPRHAECDADQRATNELHAIACVCECTTVEADRNHRQELDDAE